MTNLSEPLRLQFPKHPTSHALDLNCHSRDSDDLHRSLNAGLNNNGHATGFVPCDKNWILPGAWSNRLPGENHVIAWGKPAEGEPSISFGRHLAIQCVVFTVALRDQCD